MAVNKIDNVSSLGKIFQFQKSSINKIDNLAIAGSTRYSLYVDGEEKGTDTSQSEITSPVTMANFGLATTAQPSVGDNYHCIIDNCFASNDIDADLYSLRNYSESVPGRGDYVMFWWRCDGNTSYEAVWNSDFDYVISGSPYTWGDAYVNLTQTSNDSLYKSATRSAHIHATNYNSDGPSSVFAGGLESMPSAKGRIASWVRLPDLGAAHTVGSMFGLGTFEYVGESFRQAMICVMFTPGTYPDITCSVAVADIVGSVPNYYVMPSISASLTYDTWYFIELAYNLNGS